MSDPNLLLISTQVRIKKREVQGLNYLSFFSRFDSAAQKQRSSEMNHSNIQSSYSRKEARLAPVRCLYNASIGIDVHSELLVCCYQAYDPHTQTLTSQTEKFGTSASQLIEFVQWVSQRKPEIVLMESTGVYWFSPYNALEKAGFNSRSLAVVNARDIKAAYGRKSDKADAARLAEFARMNSFKRSFVPCAQIRTARQIGRRLFSATQDCTREANRMQKLLSSSGTRFSSVFSSFKGKTAQRILNSFLDDPRPVFLKCVKQNCSRLKASFNQIIDAFSSLEDPLAKQLLLEQRRIWRQACEHREALEKLLSDSMIAYRPLIDRLCTIPGICELSAMKIVSEIGSDLSSFRNSESFCSWIGVCCGNNESAGKAKKVGTPKGNRYLRSYLAEIGQAIGLMRKSRTCLHEEFLAFRERRGHNRAVIAIAHKLARIIYAMIKNGGTYIEQQSDKLKKQRIQSLEKSLSRAKKSGVICQQTNIIDETSGEIITGT